MKLFILSGVFALSSMLLARPVLADQYAVDTQGMHAAINFRIKHLGYSWLTGRFNEFSGNFSYDANAPESARINIEIDPASIDSNHAERDKHLRGKDFLDVKSHPKAQFVSTKVEPQEDGKALVYGKLTLRGVTRDIAIAVQSVGSGADPWGGYRQGFSGTTQIALKDFGIDYNLGPASTHVELDLHIEGVRQN